jgi:hypothetical protein
VLLVIGLFLGLVGAIILEALLTFPWAPFHDR